MVSLQKESEWELKLQEKIKENKFVTPSSHLDVEEIKSFIRETLSNREKEIAEEVEKMREVCHEPTNDSVENARREKWNLIITGKNLVVDRVLSIINKHQ